MWPQMTFFNFRVYQVKRNSEKDDSSSSEDVEDESEDIDDDLTPPLLD